MTHSEGIGKIALALAKAQAAIEGASKDQTNPHFKSRYADLASIRDACQKPLAENEIAVVQSSSADANLVRMTTMLLHSSGEWIQSDVLQVQARDANPQAVGSCLTYLRRYQLAAMVGVAPIDDDAEEAEGRDAAAPTSRPSVDRPGSRGGGWAIPEPVDVPTWDDDGPDLAVDIPKPTGWPPMPLPIPPPPKPPPIPKGFALIDDYKPDGDWHRFTWGRDAQGGWMEYKTKLGHIAEPAIDAFRAKVPVKLHSKKLPLLDKVEVLP